MPISVLVRDPGLRLVPKYKHILGTPFDRKCSTTGVDGGDLRCEMLGKIFPVRSMRCFSSHLTTNGLRVKGLRLRV